MADQQQKQPRKFSGAALSEARNAVERTAAILQERPAVQGITIDGPASKDLDDALWLENNSHGGYILHISIADAGALITPTTTPALDKEALARSFTRYYADRNLPMLPRELSEGSLSLLQEQPRPAITITIPLDAQLQAGEPTIRQTRITSSKRFSYDEVDQDIAKPHTTFAPMLQTSFLIAQKLLQMRRARGALAIYDLQTGWATTEEGMLIQLQAGERNKAHIIIQEFMILANQAFALYFAQRGLPVLYRNHAATPIAPERSALLKMIDTAISHPEQANPERVRATVYLALERARYAPTVEGHFGLNLPAYIHMTSPLRRYPDLVNQHILHAALQDEPLPYTKAELAAIAAHVNAEEDSVKDAKRAHFLAEHDATIRSTVAEATQTPTNRPLAHLDTKQFHSVLRMAAESNALTSAIEQEILTRLDEQTLQAHDIFTLVFRYQNNAPAWQTIKQAALAWLQESPHHAVSILVMGHQSLGWSEPAWDITTNGPGHDLAFTAIAGIDIGEQHYLSSPQSASQKELAKQLASAELLALIAGIDLPSSTIAEPDAVEESPAADIETLSEIDTQNYKGQLQELAQASKWRLPTYTPGPRTGPPHAPTFTTAAQITIAGTTYTAQGAGSSKTKAEQAAARTLLELIPQPAATKTPINHRQKRRKLAQRTRPASGDQ